MSPPRKKCTREVFSLIFHAFLARADGAVRRSPGPLRNVVSRGAAIDDLGSLRPTAGRPIRNVRDRHRQGGRREWRPRSPPRPIFHPTTIGGVYVRCASSFVVVSDEDRPSMSAAFSRIHMDTTLLLHSEESPSSPVQAASHTSATPTRRERAVALIVGLGLDDLFQFSTEPGVCPRADSTSGSGGELEGDGPPPPPPSIQQLALLAYKASSKQRRRRAEWWLFAGKALQAIRLLLDAVAVVNRAAHCVDPADLPLLVCTPTNDEEEPSTDGCIQVPSIAEAAAAVGLGTNTAFGLSLAAKRELNLRIIAMARKLINDQGDPKV